MRKNNQGKDKIFVYIDESGDLGKFGTDYFTVAGVVVEEPLILKRIIKKIRQRKLKKSIKQLPELKANKTNEFVKKAILKKISDSNLKIFAIVVEKTKILPHLYDVKDRLYNYICRILIDEIVEENYVSVHIIVDKKYTNTLIRENFNSYIQKKINEKNSHIVVNIEHRDSQATPELQVVDFVAWAINRKFNSNDEIYYRMIEKNIVNKERILLWKNQT
ncbi:MAG: DUF3800 domain-containing protein [Thermoplasmata archaeon]